MYNGLESCNRSLESSANRSTSIEGPRTGQDGNRVVEVDENFKNGGTKRIVVSERVDCRFQSF